ncbi:hypothetical protein [Paenibacillus sp. NEAU-GSW1]|uniref:hypothetical protein n=1 Tax=Paenibacillus sp. NEAU-GSW1 TaxID=2682486 RepID=UPI0012E2F832|nr:hypothetical protein [Paenibacillus sp. NEAU-GSW1]MUT68720.1 hypothetical protein [Paenibacillus sp. NEAU-GSW1]
MKIWKKTTLSNWPKSVFLGLALTLTAGTAQAAITPDGASAAAQKSAVSAAEGSAVYKKFEHYVSKPASLATARNYLINHIREVSKSEATVMTLHLENAQKAHLAAFSEKIYAERIQQALDKAYQDNGYSIEGLMHATTDKAAKALLIEARDKGYKLEASEGLYYPVMHYQGFKQFRSYINKDIAAYIDLMAVDSNSPIMFDAAIVVSWDELIKRAIAMEVFLKQYPKSNRATAVKQLFAMTQAAVLYGANNTPAYDAYSESGDKISIDPEVRAAYESAVETDKTDSTLAARLEKLLALLDETDNVFTAEVEQLLEHFMQEANK